MQFNTCTTSLTYLSGGAEKTAHAFRVPRALKRSDEADEEFETVVETFWSTVTGVPYEADNDEEYAETLRTENDIGLRRNLFHDAVPVPWYKGLIEDDEDDDDTEDAPLDEDSDKYFERVHYEAVEEQVRKVLEQNVQDSAAGKQQSFVWHPYFLLEHFLCKGGGTQ